MNLRLPVVPLLALATLIAGCAARGSTTPPPAGGAWHGLAELALGATASLGDVEVTAIRVDEDSRCPTGVQCIQAGTVRLAVRVDDGGSAGEQQLTLGQPLRLGSGRWLILAGVCPYPRSTVAIRPADYRFTIALGSTAPAPASVSPCPDNN